MRFNLRQAPHSSRTRLAGLRRSRYWQPLEGRRACRIKKTCATGGYRDEDMWEAVYEELAVAMAKLESAFKPHIKGL